MPSHHPGEHLGEVVNRVLVRTTRGWLLEQAEVGSASEWAEKLVNEVNERLNSGAEASHPDRLNVASSVVARALIARGIVRIAAQWLSDETGMPVPLALAALKSIMDELPPGLESEIVNEPEPLNA